MEVNQLLTDLLILIEKIEDPRIDRCKKYLSGEILFLTICAVISGCQDWYDIEDFGESKEAWLKNYYPYENGTPSHDTLNRFFSVIDPRAFEECFVQWVTQHLTLAAGTVINIDGKSLRGSVTKQEQQTARVNGGKQAIHLVEAWCSEFSLCLCQYQTEEKSNEITAIPEVIDALSIKGCVLTIDAMGCQKAIAEKIIEKGADYVFGLKNNQETLCKAVKEAFEQDQSFKEDQQGNRGHGRLEARLCRTLPAAVLGDKIDLSEWTAMTTIVEIRSARKILSTGAIQTEKRYYITSLGDDPKRLNTIIRQHWGIENKLHWMLDVYFGEDMSRKRATNSATNFALVARMCLNLLKNNDDNISIKRKLKKCSMSDDYRAKTLRI